MRPSLLFTVILGLLLACAPARGQDKPSVGDSSSTPPPPLGGKTLEQWCKEIRDRDPSFRENAIRTVMLYGRDAQKLAGPYLVSELTDDDTSCRVNAVIAIGVIGLDTKDLANGIKALTGNLTNTQAIVRYQAAMALGRLGPDAKAAIPQLAQYTLNDRQSWELRRAAAFALGRIARDKENGPSAQAVSALIGRLASEPAAQVRFECVMALGMLGPPSDPQLAGSLTKALEGAAGDRDKTVQVWSRVLLREITKGTPAADAHLAAIGKMLEAPELVARTHAAEAIGSIGPDAKACVPGLIKLLKDKEPVAVLKGVFALAALEDAAKPAIAALEELKKSDNEDYKDAATYAIEAISKKPKPKKP
jgi:HEAT repeat protein